MTTTEQPLADWINADLSICRFIAKLLVEMADKCHGYPPDSTPEEWDATLRRLAAVFADYSGSLSDGAHPINVRAFEDAWLELGALMPHLWD